MTMQQRLKGKVAIVTGASSGIGEATALALAHEGCNVALVARRKDRLQALSERIAEMGVSALKILGDVSDLRSAEAAIEQTRTLWKRVDILVNNAGVMLLDTVERARVEDWQRMMHTNVLGVMYCTRVVVPIMKEQKSGHI